jgi:hypothetical protein
MVSSLVPSSEVSETMALLMIAFEGSVTRPVIPVCCAQARPADSAIATANFEFIAFLFKANVGVRQG